MGIPTSIRRPGIFHEIKVDEGGAVVQLPVRLLFAAIKSSAGTATAGTPVRVLDETEAETLAGKGSQAHLGMRAAFDQGRRGGSGTPEIWFAPIAAPAGVASTRTLTVTVTAATAGAIYLDIAGRVIVASVNGGAAATAIATDLAAAINAEARNLPVTASVAGAVVTCTTVHAGVHGEDIKYRVISTPSGVSVASAAGVTGTGVVDITATLDVLLSRHYDAIVLGNHGATDIADAIAHTDVAWGFAEKRPRHVVIGEHGTLAVASALGVAANSKAVMVFAYEGCPSLPIEIAARGAVAVWSKTRRDGTAKPNANLDGERLFLPPPQAPDAFTAAEVEALITAGVTALTPTDDGQAAKIERAVTTKTTTSGSFTESELDIGYSRTQAYLVLMTDAKIAQNHKQETRDAKLLDRVRDTVLAVHRSAADGDEPILVGVEDLKSQIVASYASAPDGRILVDAPFRVAGAHHQTVITHRQIYAAGN